MLTHDEFVADPKRKFSPEADYGVWWQDGKTWPKYRLSYIAETGEVYAVQMGAPHEVKVLGVVPPDVDWRRSADSYYRTLDRILEGWAEHSWSPDLSWVRERLAAAEEAIA